jgi:hypothetical protein
LHEDFVQAINTFVYSTPTRDALEGLDGDGSRELLCRKSKEVRDKILALFLPLPSQFTDVVPGLLNPLTSLAVDKSYMIPDVTSHLTADIPPEVPYSFEGLLSKQLAAMSSDESNSFLSKRSSPHTVLPLPSQLITQLCALYNVFFGGQEPRL